ncbi:hypothetical protein [Thermoactinomyces vulgaris]|jgi:hypothetical protein|uniref:hypothetical protein n=1 Tax=Thermoactinomyces vulgaris TaxID=2026 RepID=UPI0011077809|nr:hypothetical protein [Thermoactinomyces vulgaris]QCV56278.1 hypothetical protein FA954_12030 [Thermoactinomyces vulgaris]
MNRAAKRRGRPAQSEPNYIACLDWNFGWQHPRDFEELKRAWEQGYGYEDIARALGRPENEVIMYIMDHWVKETCPIVLEASGEGGGEDEIVSSDT